MSKSSLKKPSPQIETHPHTQNNAIHFTFLCTEMEIHFSFLKKDTWEMQSKNLIAKNEIPIKDERKGIMG